MDFKCTCLNSGTNSFTGHCDRCGMSKPSNGTITHISIVEKLEPTQMIHNIKLGILSLPRYTCYVDCQCDCMEEEVDGKYVKLEDVLTLFLREKE